MTHDEWLDAAANELFLNDIYPLDTQEKYREWLTAILATRPAPGRAEVEKAVYEYGRESYSLGQSDVNDGTLTDEPRKAALAALLALYAEPVGEVCDVLRVTPMTRSGRQEAIIDLRADRMPLAPGQRVRVVRVAE